MMIAPVVRAAAIACALLVAADAAAQTETLLMPKRDGIAGQPMVVWGITTLPNSVSGSTTTYSFNFGDNTPNAAGNVTTAVTSTNLERSYIAVLHTFTAAGTYDVTLTVTNQQQGTRAATVQVTIFDPGTFPGPGTKTGQVGPGSNEQYRNLRVNMAIQDGLRFLWVNQNTRAANLTATTTNWGGSFFPSWTGFVVAAFQNQGYRLANDGSAPAGLYEKYIVQRGLNYVISNLEEISIGTGPTRLNQPQERNPCIGGVENTALPSPPNPAPPAAPIYFTCQSLTETSARPGYGVSIAMMAMSSTGALDRVNGAIGPLVARNKTYREILQRLTNTLTYGQLDSPALARGGWGYDMNINPSNLQDGSVMGWAIVGLLDAEAVGIDIPTWVRDELPLSLTNGINTTGAANGSFEYNPNGAGTAGAHVGMEKGGIPLQLMFAINETSGTRVDAVMNYISLRWNAAGRVTGDTEGGTCGVNNNFGCAYSMFNNFKGLKLQNIDTFNAVGRAAGPGAIPANDWYAHYVDWLVNFQTNPTTTAGGQWPMRFSNYGDHVGGNAAIAELILSGVALVLPDRDKFATVGLSPATFTLVEGGTHTVTAKAQSADGTPVAGATVNFEIIEGLNAGLFSGTDVTDANGEATFTYTDPGPLRTFGTDKIRASIGTLQSNIAVMVWQPFNRPPVANPNSYIFDEDTVLQGNVIIDDPVDTDPDPEDLVLTAALVTDAVHGALTLNIDGSFTYTPAANFCGTDGFSYDLNDGEEDSNVAAVSITVTCVNDAPVAGDGEASTPEDTPVTAMVTAADVDLDTPTFSLATPPAHGNVVIGNGGTYTYIPAPDYHGPDSFTFTASDGHGGSDVGTVTVTVTPVNDAPVAGLHTATTMEDTPVSAAAASSDVDGDTLTYSQATSPAHGSVVMNGDGTYTYVPEPDYNGPDAFTFTVSDGNGGSDVGTVNIDVTPVNDAPTAGDDNASTTEDTPVDALVSGNDADVDSASLTWSKATDPAHGSVIVNADGTFTYTPAADYCGADSFGYTVSDGTLTATATVNISIACVNDAPIAADATPSTSEDTQVSAAVASIDPDGDTVTYALTTPPSHGTVVVNPDGTYTYTPDPDYHGPDSFTFTVSDGNGGSDVGTVNLDVTSVNDAPVAGINAPTTDEDTAVSTTAASTDVDGDTLTYEVATPPSHGTVVVNPDGTYTYTPAPNYNGPDSFTFTVSDGNGASDTGTVDIVVSAVNDPPVPAVNEASTPEDTPVTSAAGWTDPDGDTLSYHLATPPAHGTVVFNPDGSYVYTPGPNYHGDDSFTFTADDGHGASVGGTVNLVITSVNDPPVPNVSAATTPEDTPLSSAAGWTDPDGDVLTYTLITPPVHGDVVLNPDGTYTYTPDEDYTGTDRFTFSVDDGHGAVATGEVNITIGVVNDPPFCAAAAPSVDMLWPPNHQLVDINVLGVTDPVEGSAVSIEITGIWQDEPTNTQGDGNTPIDGYGVGTSTARVRAERSGNKRVPGDGRMYYISFTATDSQGATCTGTVKVGVPHDQGRGDTIQDGGALYKSTGS